MFSTIWKKKKNGSNCVGSAYQRVKILDKFVKGNYFPVTTKCHEITKNPCSFLKSCHLCQKPLSLDKEVYMYMGEMGFCSVDCRNREMYLEEMKKIEIATRRILTSFQQRRREGGGQCQIRDRREADYTAAPPIFISE